MLWSECDADKVIVKGENSLSNVFKDHLEKMHKILERKIEFNKEKCLEIIENNYEIKDTIFDSKKRNPSFITHHSVFYINHSWSHIFTNNQAPTWNLPLRMKSFPRDMPPLYPKSWRLASKSWDEMESLSLDHLYCQCMLWQALSTKVSQGLERTK